MAIQRLVLKGTISSTVQIRNMFTADVVETGGDVATSLWSAYILSVLDPMTDLLWSGVHFYGYDLMDYTGGHWIPFAEVIISQSGAVTGQQLANQLAAVLIGKAEGLRHVGRKFLGALSEDNITGNTLDSVAVAAAAATLAAWLTPLVGIGGGTLTPGVVDKDGEFHRFVGGFVSSLIGSMRRRKPGVGL